MIPGSTVYTFSGAIDRLVVNNLALFTSLDLVFAVSLCVSKTATASNGSNGTDLESIVANGHSDWDL